MATGGRGLIPPGAGEAAIMGGFGVIFKLSGEETGGALAIVEHPLQPGALDGPPHTYTNQAPKAPASMVGRAALTG